MRIVLGSENLSKRKSVVMALEELGITQYDICVVNSSSNVSSKPIGFEIIRGAENRNQESRKICNKQCIDFDYLCAIEGGFSLDENGLPFVVTYAIIENKEGDKSTGKSLGIRIRKEMFDYVKNGGSLNKLIEKITGESDNKKSQGITGYLSGGIYTRDKVDKDAVMSAFIPILYKDNRDRLSEEIKMELKKK